MFAMRTSGRGRSREEGEKPFWISFSDLMSALMVLFLIATTVALVSVTKKVSQAEKDENERIKAIQTILGEVKDVVDGIQGVSLDGNTIKFGPQVRFEREGQNTLSDSQRAVLLQFAPQLLAKLRTPEAERWLKRVVVEGYASQTGTYLLNLNLSLERSERVLCELLRKPPEGTPLSLDDRKFIASRFVVGGASFNSLKATQDDSRRVELRLDFRTVAEMREMQESPPVTIDQAMLAAALDVNERCPVKDR